MLATINVSQSDLSERTTKVKFFLLTLINPAASQRMQKSRTQ